MPSRDKVSKRRRVSAGARAVVRRRLGKGREETVAGIPVSKIGLRIERYAMDPLADLLRESYWMSKGAAVWRRVCRNSLNARCAVTRVDLVRRLGGA